VKDGRFVPDDNKHIVLGRTDGISCAAAARASDQVKDSPSLASTFLTLLVMQRGGPEPC
jgi:hypothetical protein